MLSLSTPLWLLGLALVPVIRWLHRRGPNLRGVAVSSLDLWRQAAASSPARGAHRPPDPAWRRRALITALLFVALSGPQIREQRARITIWVDDSLSMLSLESRGTRLAEGLAHLRAALDEGPAADVEVRTLGDPWQSLDGLTDATVATIVRGAGRQEPTAPPESLLRRDSLHWLLTDGADATLLDWPGARRPDRMFRIAERTRNVGLERLSARRNLNDPDRYDVLLKVTNGGTAVEERSVILATDAGEWARSTQRLEPGAFALVHASVPASGSVRARLEPGDALTADDEIVLGLDALRRRRVTADPGCPAALLAAVRAHPALSLVEQGAGGAEVVLDCGMHAAHDDVATIRVLAQHAPKTPKGALQWSSSVPQARRIRLETQFLQVAAHLELRPADTVLLAAGDEPLIVARAGAPRVLDTVLDFASAASGRRAEIPLLVDFLFEGVLGGDLLGAIATVDRGPNAVKVAPVETTGVSVDRDAPGDLRTRDVALPFLVGALLVLLREIVALMRRWHRARDHAGIVSA